MIYFKSVKWKNLLSTGNVFTELKLNKSSNTLVIGENGSGKSTFIDAISFALYDKPFRKVSKTQIINTINKKELFKIETLTLAPYDIDLITKSLLTNEELIWIKNYHNTVFKKISPYLDKNEKSWLFKEINKL